MVISAAASFLPLCWTRPITLSFLDEILPLFQFDLDLSRRHSSQEAQPKIVEEEAIFLPFKVHNNC